MYKNLRLVWLALGLAFAGGAQAALDAAEQRFVDRLAKGGPDTIRDVAETLFQSGNTNPEVLDVAAEVLLSRYQRANDRGTSDAMAWLCRALGGSGNNRYKAALDEVADKGENRKLQGHCEKASKGLPKGATNSYTAGTVNLEKLRNASAPATPAAQPAAKAAAAQGGARTVDLSLIREGMSSQEVNDLLGPPTAQTQHMTGKQFRPFNFGARDLQRMYYLYKGVGRVEFSLKSAYEGVYRVIAVTPDPNESGYP
jgi:hypothetical protein